MQYGKVAYKLKLKEAKDNLRIKYKYKYEERAVRRLGEITRKSVCVMGIVAAAGVSLLFASTTYAAPNQVDGTVFYDQNNNGVHDVGEPGIEGVLVRFGTSGSSPRTYTDANGQYALTGVSGSATVQVLAGWFRSQCNSLNCAVGPGADNDFGVNNQFIETAGVDGTAGATLNVGLIPDWDDQETYVTYPADGVTVTGTPVDVATRLSYTTGCSAGLPAERLCNPGSIARFRIAIFNQGTSTITNPVFSLQAPVGHHIRDTTGLGWFDNGQAIPSANTVTNLQPYDSGLGHGLYRLNGTIPPGASSTMFVEMDVLSSAIGSPSPYATTDPRDKQMVLQVLGMDQSGDWDSTFCLSAGQNWLYGTCGLNPLGNHDSNLHSDHTDGASWNVTGTPESRVDSMSLAMSVTDPTVPVMVCNNASPSPGIVTMAMQVTNTSTGDTPLRNVEIVAEVPSGFTFDLIDNPGWFIGGDGKPHTFVNLPFLPSASVEVPLQLRMNDSVTLGDNGTSVLRPSGSIVGYDTAQTDPVSRQFIPGSLSGTLAADADVEVASSACTVGDSDDLLADTGSSIMGLVAVATSSLAITVAIIARLVWPHQARTK